MRTSRIEMNAIAGVVILFGSLTVAVAELRPTPDGDCADLRGENGAISCSYKAYETWLDAGRENSKLDSVCHNDLVELTQKCNMIDFLENKLDDSEKRAEAHSKIHINNLFEFLNRPGIELYREKHPDEPSLHLDERDERSCCQSRDDSPMMEIKDARLREKCHSARKLVQTNENLDETILDKINNEISKCIFVYVIKPCGRYLNLMDDLFFGSLKGIVAKTMNNDWSFLRHQTERFRDAVFRYQHCLAWHARDFDTSYKGLDRLDQSDDNEDAEAFLSIFEEPDIKAEIDKLEKNVQM